MATATLPPPQTTETTTTSTTPTPAPTTALTLYRLSYDKYERIGELGLLGSTDKVVLLDGMLVNQMTKGTEHAVAVLRGLAVLQAAIPAGWHVRPEQPIALRGGPHGDSAPEPDLTVVLGDIERYIRQHPTGTEIGLVIEVASAIDAVRIDRAALSRYAFANIPIACIVNLATRTLEVYSDPSGVTPDPSYRSLTTLRDDQTFAAEFGNPSTGPAAITPIPVSAFFAPL